MFADTAKGSGAGAGAGAGAADTCVCADKAAASIIMSMVAGALSRVIVNSAVSDLRNEFVRRRIGRQTMAQALHMVSECHFSVQLTAQHRAIE